MIATSGPISKAAHIVPSGPAAMPWGIGSGETRQGDMVDTMRITVLGGCGAWPEAGKSCSGFLVEHQDFRLVIDLGYATLPHLLEHSAPHQIEAVLISHGHPDHCADLNPLLRARALNDAPPPALPVYAPPGELDAVLALDRPGMLDDAYDLHEFEPGERIPLGPFDITTRLLPHSRTNAGIRLSADDQTLAYTGDTGPEPYIADLARDADLFIAEATYAEQVPRDLALQLSSAREAGENAAEARADRLLLTHLWPGSDPQPFIEAARRSYTGEIAVAEPRLVIDLA
nr:MBL fold metallo-hydrolase [Glycomyces salinus]